MRDIFITIIATIAIYILCIIFKINKTNVFIEYILDIIPAAIPLSILFINRPKFLIKRNFLFKREMYYELSISISAEKLNSAILDELIGRFCSGIGNRVLKKSDGAYIYIAILEVSRAVINIEYNYETNTLFLNSKQDITTDKFLKKIERIYEIVQEWAQKNVIEKQTVEVDIHFINDDEPSENNIMKHIFSDFNNGILDFKYYGHAGSIIQIYNKNISFKSNNLQASKDDMYSELKFNLQKRSK